MESRLAKLPAKQRENQRLVQPLGSVTADKQTAMKFEKINMSARQKIAAEDADVQKFRDQRDRWESPGEGHNAGTPPGERNRPAAPRGERGGPGAPPGARAPQANPSPDRTAPPTSRGESEKPITSGDRRGSAGPPTGRTTPTASRGERKEAVNPPVERAPDVVPPRKVKATRPERVQIPASPVVGRPPADAKPPARPDDEQGRRGGAGDNRGGGGGDRGN